MTTVTYDNAESSWNEALPLGNGHFGGMIYFVDRRLRFALNHYEVYYRKLRRYSRKPRESEPADYRLQYGRTFEELRWRTIEMYRDPAEEPIFLYGDALTEGSMHRAYGKAPGGVSHYPTGELHLCPADVLAEPDDYALQLDVEHAVARLHIEKAGKRLEASTFVAQAGDYVMTEIRQSETALLESVVLTVPSVRYAEMDTAYHRHDESSFYYVGSIYPDGEDRARYRPFSFLVMTQLVGAKGDMEPATDSVRIRLRDAANDVTLLTAVVTEAQTDDLLGEALRRLALSAEQREELKADHASYWRSFWQQSSVTLPDKLLEDLWRINLYAIACSSGKGGSMPEQACGLNGLWDIKQPTKWGSMWYWDVNIQAAFWPLYTANHLDIAEVFNEGLLTYADEAGRMAKQFYGVDGIAGDYPHALYLSIWPWCAQFPWNYYRYGMDEDFLRDQAYPLFREIARFFEARWEAEAESGQLNAFPDISPEQGPLTRNSTCTLASVKYLFGMAAEANERLGEAEEDRLRWRALADRLAPYPTAVSGRYGDVLLDSEWAPADMRLRHPSLLMPIYPVGEIDRHSEAELRRRAENTLRYVEENTEFGMFQFGWLSCAASRLGKGDTALRILYEQGIDLSLRCNGLFAEETERWMNYCNITNEPLYHPHMMEASGEVVAALNEMLLQSYDGIISVFPAVPAGTIETERLAGLYDHRTEEKASVYGSWDSCSFRGLLAVGGFEVSAERTDGRTVWVGIRSLAGGELVLRDPFLGETGVVVEKVDGEERARVEFSAVGGCIRFVTERGGEYALNLADDSGQSGETAIAACSGRGSVMSNFVAPSVRAAPSVHIGSQVHVEPRVHVAHTQRRVFLGKDRDTHHFRMLDHFTFDYYAGNSRESRLAAYRLDFGVLPEQLAKDYEQALPRQVHVEGIPGQTFRKITVQTLFTPRSGIGWESGAMLEALDRGEPDALRRDFIGGKEEAVFRLELPKGRYDLLIVSGDGSVPSGTRLCFADESAWTTERALAAGEFATDIVPLTQKRDGCATLRFLPFAGQPWRVNLLIVNKRYSYL